MNARVLMLGSSGDLYGAPRVLLSSALALKVAGVEAVVALPTDGPLVGSLKAIGVEVHVLRDFALRRRSFHPAGLPPLIWEQARLARWTLIQHRRAPFDLVYSNTQSVIAGPAIALLLRRPHLWHVHEILESPGWLARSLAVAAVFGSSTIVCPSVAVAANLRRLAPATVCDVVVLPNGIDAEALRLLEPPRRGESLRVGCIARLHPGKGQHVAISATAEARRRGVPVILQLYGGPAPGNEHIEKNLRARVAADQLTEAVRFGGFERDTAAMYAGLDVVVVPSTSPEAFSLVCLEAQAAGRPVIASNDGGPRELILHGKTGLLVAPGSAHAVASALEHFWRKPEQIVAMGERGRERVLAGFTNAAFAHGLLSILDQAVEGGLRN